MLPIDPKQVVRGQYTGYRSEAGVDPKSDTETFIALKCGINNWRCSPCRSSSHRQAAGGGPADHLHCLPRTAQEHVPAGVGCQRAGPDRLTFDLADAAKMSLSFYGKRPGPGMRLDELSMQFAMHDTGPARCSKVILDAMRGEGSAVHDRGGHREALRKCRCPLLEAPPAGALSPRRLGARSIARWSRPMSAAANSCRRNPNPRTAVVCNYVKTLARRGGELTRLSAACGICAQPNRNPPRNGLRVRSVYSFSRKHGRRLWRSGAMPRRALRAAAYQLFRTCHADG